MLKSKKVNPKGPILIILFSIIFGTLTNITLQSTFLKANKIIAGIVVLLIFAISILLTYKISEKYLNKYFDKFKK